MSEPEIDAELEYRDYDKELFFVAEGIIDANVTPDMLKYAARQAQMTTSAIRDAYVDGAMLGIRAMQDSLLDLIAAKGKQK